MSGPAQPWTSEEAAGDSVSKKDLVTFLHEHASIKLQTEHKIKGQLKSITKSRTKDQLVAAYTQLFETKSFKQEGEEEEAAAAAATAQAAKDKELADKAEKLKLQDEAAASAEPEAIRYKKSILRKGDKINFPKKGDMVSCYYTGKLADGKVFDTNAGEKAGGKKKKLQPLKFKVGLGKVIRGWDEGIMTMSAGEKCELVIEPEWAYGRRGIDNKIPPNSTLTFEIELVTIN